MSKLDKYYSKSLKEITANNTFNMMISLDSVLFENIPSLGTLFLSQCCITRAYKMGGAASCVTTNQSKETAEYYYT